MYFGGVKVKRTIALVEGGGPCREAGSSTSQITIRVDSLGQKQAPAHAYKLCLDSEIPGVALQLHDFILFKTAAG